MALVGIPVGLYLFFDVAIPLGQEWARSGNAPSADLFAQLKVMTPIVLGIVGVNLFIHKDGGQKPGE